MFIDIIDSIAACLDRESAKKINNLPLEEKILQGMQELRMKKLPTVTNPRDPISEDAMRFIELYLLRSFVAHLQMKARAVLRRPRSAGPTPSSGS